jgi:hypothetical protein
LFGIEDRSKPDPAQQSEDKQTELALAPASRQYGPDAGLSFWKAELVRRHGVFCSKLSMAARCGDVRLMGIPVEAPWALEPSTFASLLQDIPAAYFSVDRDFDEDSCIHAIGPEAPEPEYDEADGRYVSSRDVVVERASFLRFLKVTYPSVLNAARAQDQLKTKEAIRVLAQALGEDPDLSRAEAAKLVGWSMRSRRFDSEIWPEARKQSGLPPRAPAGRKRKSPQM